MDEVNVQIVPRHESVKVPLSLKDSGLQELAAVRNYTVVSDYSSDKRIDTNGDAKTRELYITWQDGLNHYADQIAALQAELESTRAEFGQRMDAHRARLQELSHVISTDANNVDRRFLTF